MGAKNNLKQYLAKKDISPARFYRETGLSNGFLNQGDNISSNNIEIIISIFPDLNLNWLITGRGDMLNIINEQEKNAYPNAYPNAYLSPILEESSFNTSLVAESAGEYHANKNSNAIVKHLIEVLREQSEEIGALKQENSSLKSQLVKLADSAPNASSVPA